MHAAGPTLSRQTSHTYLIWEVINKGVGLRPFQFSRWTRSQHRLIMSCFVCHTERNFNTWILQEAIMVQIVIKPHQERLRQQRMFDLLPSQSKRLRKITLIHMVLYHMILRQPGRQHPCKINKKWHKRMANMDDPHRWLEISNTRQTHSVIKSI